MSLLRHTPTKVDELEIIIIVSDIILIASVSPSLLSGNTIGLWGPFRVPLTPKPQNPTKMKNYALNFRNYNMYTEEKKLIMSVINAIIST